MDALIDHLIALIRQGRPRLSDTFLAWLRAYYEGQTGEHTLPDSGAYLIVRIHDELLRLKENEDWPRFEN